MVSITLNTTAHCMYCGLQLSGSHPFVEILPTTSVLLLISDNNMHAFAVEVTLSFALQLS